MIQRRFGVSEVARTVRELQPMQRGQRLGLEVSRLRDELRNIGLQVRAGCTPLKPPTLLKIAL